MLMQDRSSILVSMNRLSTEARVRVVAALVEGNSIRATVRMTGVAKNTITKLLVDLGTACSAFQDEALRGLPCTRVQSDEIWSFVGGKEKAKAAGADVHGDVWTWTALCADTKLAVSWLVADRSGESATEFMQDVASRLANRVQLTTDGHRAYLEAVEQAFGGDVDYAMLQKLYGAERNGEARYSPAKCIGCEKKVKVGNPDPAHVSTSYVERQNLSMRKGIRRFTRLTNAFSKKLENHMHAISIYFMHYNFARVHQTLRVTPAVEARVSDHVWTLEEIVGLVEAGEASDSAVVAKGWAKRRAAKTDE